MLFKATLISEFQVFILTGLLNFKTEKKRGDGGQNDVLLKL